MVALLANQPMAKRVDVPVKMDAEVVRKSKIIAAYREQTLAEFLSTTMGTIVDDLLEQAHSNEVASKTAKVKRTKGDA